LAEGDHDVRASDLVERPLGDDRHRVRVVAHRAAALGHEYGLGAGERVEHLERANHV